YVCHDHGVLVKPHACESSLHHSDFKPIVGSRAHILREGVDRINIPRLAQYYRSVLTNSIQLHPDALPEALQLGRVYCLMAYERYGEAMDALQDLSWASNRLKVWQKLGVVLKSCETEKMRSDFFSSESATSYAYLHWPVPNASVFNVQVDAMLAFLDLCLAEDEPYVTQCVSACYRRIQPVRRGALMEDSWSAFFAELYSNAFDEDDHVLGDAEGIVDGDAARDVQRNKAMRIAAECEERVTFNVKKTKSGSMLHIAATNTEEVSVRLFPVGMETLFSLKPFECVVSASSLPVQFLQSPYPQLVIHRKSAADRRNVDGFVFADVGDESVTGDDTDIEIEQVDEDEDYFERAVYLPSEFNNQSVIVEVASKNCTPIVKVVSSCALTCTTRERYGQVSVNVTSTGKCVECCYVKCFAKMLGGDVKFYKDGYTDRRGVFDYATVSAIPLDQVSEFSILISHAELGYVILSAKPPKPE
ncbi:hypothetical protein ADUPG1_013991, partial [Aduncisulcus paluster]